MPSLRQNEMEISSSGPERSIALGTELGGLLQAGDVICLSGELGAGKTIFSRGIGAGWGATIALTSPTYNLVHEHQRHQDDARLYHLDLYRIDGAKDAETLGLDDLLESDAAVILEWPERIQAMLPSAHLWVDIILLEDLQRRFFFESRGARHTNLLAAFRQLVCDRG